MTPRMVNAIPTANASLAGFGFGAMYPSWLRIDVAMPDFRGANRKRCMSYVTLRCLSKKCTLWRERAPIIVRSVKSQPSLGLAAGAFFLLAVVGVGTWEPTPACCPACTQNSD